MIGAGAISLRDDARKMIESALESGRTMLSEPEAKALLVSSGIPVPESVVVEDFADLDSNMGSMRGPFAVKAVSKTVVHKTEVGAVHVGLLDQEAVDTAMREMKKNLLNLGHDVDSFLVEKMAPAGIELVLGAVRRPRIGWVVMLGLGGTLVEVLDDVALGIAPLKENDVIRMLSQLRGHKVLAGIRGSSGVDRELLVEVIMAFAGASGLLSALPPEIVEVDINPIICDSTVCVAVDARMMVDTPVEAKEHRVHAPEIDYRSLFNPQTIAVLGASETSSGMANLFIRRTQEYGFSGRIYPVHPRADMVEGLQAYRSIDDIPEPVDYAYVALPAPSVAPMLSVAPGQLGVAQVVSSGFGETSEGVEHQQALSSAAERSKFRFVGPNCLGMHSSRSRVTFLDNVSAEPGPVSIVSQSGGLAVDILRHGEARGVTFNNVISIGNSADITPAELTRYLLEDPETKVIGLYLESLADAVEVQQVLVSMANRKPVVLLAGGRTHLGAHSAASHTGAMVADHKLWPAVADQSGMHLTESLSDFVYHLGAFQYLPVSFETKNRDVILFGNGGGTSVLGSDAVATVGLELPRLPDELVARLFNLGKLAGSSLSNPIDAPAPALSQQHGAVAKNIVAAVLEQDSVPAALILHLNVGVIADNSLGGTDLNGPILEAVIGAVQEASQPTLLLPVLRSDGTAATDELVRGYAQQCYEAGFAAFDEISTAARAADALIRHTSEGNKNL